MKYLNTFENHVAPISKAVIIQQQASLMDKTINKEITEDEKEKLIEDDKEEEIKRKKRIKDDKKQ